MLIRVFKRRNIFKLIVLKVILLTNIDLSKIVGMSKSELITYLYSFTEDQRIKLWIEISPQIKNSKSYVGVNKYLKKSLIKYATNHSNNLEEAHNAFMLAGFSDSDAWKNIGNSLLKENNLVDASRAYAFAKEYDLVVKILIDKAISIMRLNNGEIQKYINQTRSIAEMKATNRFIATVTREFSNEYEFKEPNAVSSAPLSHNLSEDFRKTYINSDSWNFIMVALDVLIKNDLKEADIWSKIAEYFKSQHGAQWELEFIIPQCIFYDCAGKYDDALDLFFRIDSLANNRRGHYTNPRLFSKIYAESRHLKDKYDKVTFKERMITDAKEEIRDLHEAYQKYASYQHIAKCYESAEEWKSAAEYYIKYANEVYGYWSDSERIEGYAKSIEMFSKAKVDMIKVLSDLTTEIINAHNLVLMNEYNDIRPSLVKFLFDEYDKYIGKDDQIIKIILKSRSDSEKTGRYLILAKYYEKRNEWRLASYVWIKLTKLLRDSPKLKPALLAINEKIKLVEKKADEEGQSSKRFQKFMWNFRNF